MPFFFSSLRVGGLDAVVDRLLVAEFGQFAILHFELVARDRVLLQPADGRDQLRLEATAGGLQELVLGHAEFGRRHGQVDVLLVTLRQRGDHLDPVIVQVGIETGAEHRILEALGVGVEDPVHLLVLGIEPVDLTQLRPREGLAARAAERDLADLVLGLDHAELVAAHAGDAVGDREVLGALVLHDVGRSRIEGLSVRRVQVIGLEAVRQAEDGLATVMLEGVLALRAERVLVQALPALVAGEVIRGPEIAAASKDAARSAGCCG